MPGNRAPKVAYAVFVGRNPGVYSTWSEAEKQVKGFSRSSCKGYTLADGGRGKAEIEFLDFGQRKALKERDTNENVRKDVDGPSVWAAPPSAEPIRVYLSGYMPQHTTPHNHNGQQLPTPPNTSTGKKRGRPPSWEAEKDLPHEAICIGDSGAPEAVTSMKLEKKIRIPSHTGSSARISLCDSNDCSIEDSSSADELPLSPNGSDSSASDTTSKDSKPSDGGSDGTRSDRYSDDIAGKEDLNGLVVLATDVEDDSGTSSVLSNDRGCEDIFAGKEVYPQLPVPTSPRGADVDEVIYGGSDITTGCTNTALDDFSPPLDYIPSDASSDYGDFPDDPAVLDHISAMDPRTEQTLCAEQLALVDLIMNNHNVFYTGSAGCGKSTVLKHFIPLLRQKGKKVDVLAPTGKAALEVNGRTIHNYAGWAISSLGQPLDILRSEARGKKVYKRLSRTDVLVIDEISMVANHVFERLNHIMQSARDSKKPFGGVQIIVTGDFCQLPPVKGFEYCLRCGTTLGCAWDGKHECAKCKAIFNITDKWAFRSSAWKECHFRHVNLKVIHRQKDADFKALLNRRRLGEPYTFDEKWFLLEHPSERENAVKLFPRHADVTAVNDSELAQLPGQALTYSCYDHFKWNREHEALEDYQKRYPEPMNHLLEALEHHSFKPELVLKEGMLVILLANLDLDSSLANGSQGTIVGFEKNDPKLFPEVPRKWDHSSYKNQQVESFVQQTTVKVWPIVQFLSGSKRTIYPRCMVNELGDDKPYSLLSRTQIPLMAAWAMTIHKSQGMTLSRVIVNLRHSFEPGQDYVALSRAKTVEGLTVEGLPKKTMAPDEQVIEFLKENNLMPTIECNG